MAPSSSDIAKRFTAMSDEDIGRTLAGSYGQDKRKKATEEIRHAMAVLSVLIEARDD